MTARFRVPPQVGIVEGPTTGEDVLYAASLPDGPIVVLTGTALTIWQEAVSDGAPGALAERVADAYGVPVDEVRDAVEACVSDLLDRGVLEVVAST